MIFDVSNKTKQKKELTASMEEDDDDFYLMGVS